MVPFEIFLVALSLRVVAVVVAVDVLSSDRFLDGVGLFSSPDVFLAVFVTFLLLFTRVLFCVTFLDSLNCLPGGLPAFDIPENYKTFESKLLFEESLHYNFLLCCKRVY